MTTRRDFLKITAASGIAAALSASAGGAPSLNSVGTTQTVLGAIDPNALGFTLAHEHIGDAPEVLERWPDAWGGKTGLIATAVDRLKAIKAAGISTVVDLTTYDVGRDIQFLEEVSRRSGMNIIAATGQRFSPPRSRSVSMPARTTDGLAKYFANEISRGIEGTGVKAGVIKIGTSARPTALEEAGLRAAARASKATGVPIRIHTDAANRGGESDAVILEDEDVNPARVSFDHSDDSGDIDYFLGLVRRGYSLGMDHVHRGLLADFKPTFQRRAECIKAIIDAGFANKVFLSSDSEFGGSLLPEETRDWRENIDAAEGMLFTARRLLPRLRELGVSSDQIHVITVENPKTFFRRSASE
ncbi:phosphotriesterase family protein [Povalibacter sp.]|uniref:phosphotriesterase family protein n=1 Tax=Povalibacter sp. TaxID=1962978 RepID=UPI002F420126